MTAAQTRLNTALQQEVHQILCRMCKFKVAHGEFVVPCSKCGKGIKNKNTICKDCNSKHVLELHYYYEKAAA